MIELDKKEVLQFIINGGYIRIHETHLQDFYDIMSKYCLDNGYIIYQSTKLNPFSSTYIIQVELLKRKINIEYIEDVNIDESVVVDWNDIVNKKIFSKEGKNNMLKVLEIYKEKKTREIETKYDKQLEELEFNDPVQVILRETENNLKEILNTETLTLTINSNVKEFTEETLDKRDEIIKIIHVEKQNLKMQISEIEALLELAPNYEEKMKILQAYDIIDKKGKLK